MNPNEEPLDSHRVELADTRPNMLWVPYLGEVPIIMGAFIFGLGCLCITVIGWKYCFWAPIAWYGVGKLIELDYHAITKTELWFNTSAWSKWKDKKDQGGVSLTPFIANDKYRGMT